MYSTPGADVTHVAALPSAVPRNPEEVVFTVYTASLVLTWWPWWPYVAAFLLSPGTLKRRY